MMNFKQTLCAFAGALCFLSCYGDNPLGLNSATTLWYTSPARSWDEALPLGNGFMGAMVRGGVTNDTIYLNESGVWDGSYYFKPNTGFKAQLPQIRNYLFEGNHAAADALIKQYGTSPNDPHYGSFQPLGNLILTFDHVSPAENYTRSLDLSRATTHVAYTTAGVTFEREGFLSLPDRVMTFRIKASLPGQLKGSLELQREKGATVISDAQGRIILSGSCEYGGSTFYCELNVKNKNGKVSQHGNKVRFDGCDELLLLLSAQSSYGEDSPLPSAAHKQLQSATCKQLQSAQRKSYEQLLATHLADYQPYFNRVQLDLPSSTTSTLPTNERQQRAVDGNDAQFSALMFQFGRYLLLSSSRPGGLPANLQGIWNHRFTPPWFSDYTLNINFEMNYWPALVTALPELTQPFFEQMKRMYPAGQKAARERYGCNGWQTSIRSTPWGVDELRSMTSLLWQEGAAWMCTHIWEYYQYTRDRQFLAEHYYLIRDAAVFYNDFLVEHPTYKYLVSGPTTSPENRFLSPGNRKGYAVDMGTAMSTQLVSDLFDIAIQSATILKKDAGFAKELAEKKSRLAPMRIGKNGQLQEWLEDYDEVEPTHRHVSHLYGLFPGCQVTPADTPELAAAAKVSLNRRGDGGTGWCKVWKIALWARLLDAERALSLLEGVYTDSSLPNLFNTHPPFQIDGNFGATAAIAEMLMQSHRGVITLLPALPHSWQEGEVSGLKARGGYTVHIEWKEGRVTHCILVSEEGLPIKVAYNGKVQMVRPKKGEAFRLM